MGSSIGIFFKKYNILSLNSANSVKAFRENSTDQFAVPCVFLEVFVLDLSRSVKKLSLSPATCCPDQGKFLEFSQTHKIGVIGIRRFYLLKQKMSVT